MDKERLVKLLGEMSLEEKIDQMLQVTGDFYLDDKDTVLTGPAMNMGLTEENLKRAGSVLGSFGADKLIKIQKQYMEQQPHKIPMLFMLDVIHGMKTIFPIPLGQGATFDPELSKKCAAVAAKEAAVSGVHVTFAPMADLIRDARWGRCMESTGEDPYLNGRFAAAMVEGFQGENISDKYHIAACIKHFAAYGAAEGGRDYNTADICENTLRNYYLPAYEKGIKAGAALVMTAFNTVDNIPASVNVKLMRKLLREEMGFEGVLISDFGAIVETIIHGVSENEEDAAQKAIKAGVDVDMMSGVYSEYLPHLVKSGKIDEKLIDEAVLRILELKNKLGLFENPYKDADPEEEKKILMCPEHRELASEVTAKSFVLLKNEKILPLDQEKNIAFIGPYTNSRELNSTWSFTADPGSCITIEDAAKEVLPFDKIKCYQGCPMTDSEMSEEETNHLYSEAIEGAGKSDIIIMPLGEHYMQSGEAASRAVIEIPEIQMELFRKIYEVNPNIIVLLFNGRPLDIREISEKAKAVLEVWRPGTEGGRSIMDILTGRIAPSGKLPVSFPYCAGQIPVYYNSFFTGRPEPKQCEGRFYSKYLDVPTKPLYPFGFGLSYTEFRISEAGLSQKKLDRGGSITASAKVKNIGNTEGTETIQLYIRDIKSSVVRPVKELKGIRKVTLKPGEEQMVSFLIQEDMLCFWNADNEYKSEDGYFEIFIWNDSTLENGVQFELLPESK